MSSQISFRKQMEGLLNDNMDSYPDAMAWLMKKLDGVDLDEQKTEYEKFYERLQGSGPFDGHPYKANQDNFIDLIKWYRAKHLVGLKDAKYAADKYVEENFYDSDRAKRYRGEL